MEGVDQERAKRYRERASEIRAAASAMTHAESRTALMRLAETYDRLATRLESHEPTSH